MNIEQLGKIIRENWSLLLFLGAMIVFWSTTTETLKAQDSRLEKLETMVLSLEQIRVDIAVIKTKIDSIEEKI